MPKCNMFRNIFGATIVTSHGNNLNTTTKRYTDIEKHLHFIESDTRVRDNNVQITLQKLSSSVSTVCVILTKVGSIKLVYAIVIDMPEVSLKMNIVLKLTSHRGLPASMKTSNNQQPTFIPLAHCSYPLVNETIIAQGIDNIKAY